MSSNLKEFVAEIMNLLFGRLTKKTFKRIKGEDPSKYEKSPFEKNKYMLYPDDIFVDEDGNTIKEKMKFRISYEI